jgi:hypothetical protein
MAYVSQELKAKIAPKIKAILAKNGLKGTLAVRNHSTLVLNIKSGKIDFIKNFNETVQTQYGQPVRFTPATDSIDVNPYHFRSHFSGKAKQALEQLIAAMNNGNHDNSDIQTDYFDVGWYVDVNIGKWNKPYELSK